MKAIDWNPWHGCHKKSEGCLNCYVYRHDSRYEKDASLVVQNKDFRKPLQKMKNGSYKYPSKTLFYTCFTSDFLVEDAEEWRKEVWDMIRERSDCHFLFLTKRIERLSSHLPSDWGDGWDHVSIGCTCENQNRADERLPIFLSSPIKNRFIICEPLLAAIDLEKYLSKKINRIVVGGESGNEARICHFDWIISLYCQAKRQKVAFTYKQTGARLEKNGILYRIPRPLQHPQAIKAMQSLKKIQID